jgi:hypothetical protein
LNLRPQIRNLTPIIEFIDILSNHVAFVLRSRRITAESHVRF